MTDDPMPEPQLRRRRAGKNAIALSALVLAAVAFFAACVLFALQLNATSDVADQNTKLGAQNQRLTRTGRKLQLETVRNCINANINAAVVKFGSRDQRLGETSAHFTARQQYARLYVVVDCKSSQLVGSTIILSKGQTKKYVDLVAKGRAPIINKGRVVGSRSAVLKGVRTFDQLGQVPASP